MAVQGIEVRRIGHGLGRVAAVVHELAADHDLVAHLDVGAGRVLLVAEIEDAVGIELTVLGSVVGNVEGRVPESAAFPEGTGVGDAGDLALHEHLVRGIVNLIARPGKRLHGLEGRRHVVRVGLGAGAFRRADGFVGTATAAGAFVLAVVVIDEGGALDGLRGIAAEVHDVAVQDHLVTHLDVRILGGPLAVSKVQDAVGVELVAVRGAIVGDIEGGIPVGTAGPEGAAIGNLGDLTLHEHLRGTLDIGAEALDILDRTRHGERVVQRADDFLAPFARLADSEGLVVIADGELDRLVAVVPGVVQDGERHPLGLVGGQALFGGHGDPGRLVGVPEDLAGPVPVRRYIQL